MKEHVKGEFAKLKEMTWREKIDYLWEYYKLHFFAFLLILFFVILTLDAMVFNPSKKTFLGVALYGDFASIEICMEFEARLTPVLMTEENKETHKVTFTSYHIDDNNPGMTSAAIEKFVAMAYAGETDIIIASRDRVIELAQAEYLLEMSFLDGINYPLSEMLHSIVPEDEVNPGKEYPFAIPLTGTSVLNEEYYIGSDKYLCVIVSTKRAEVVIDAINFILSN